MPLPVIPVYTALEQSFVNYLSSSVSNPSSSLYQQTGYFYTGMGNSDKVQVPAITVMATDCREVYYGSQIYEATVEIFVTEMAADVSAQQMSQYAANVFNEIFTQCGYNNPSKWNNTALNFYAFQVQTIDLMHSVSEDALISTGRFRIIGGLSVT